MIKNNNKIPVSFYRKEDVIQISKSLLGKKIYSNINNHIVSGMIVETEAYNGVEDRASHAFNNNLTKRTQPMFCNGVISYVYMCYGIHCLFNIVTNNKNIPDAILIRAVQPLSGINIMKKRRKIQKDKLCSGPGCFTKSFGINLKHNQQSLISNTIWIENYKSINESNIICSPRVGIDYAKDFKLKPWRFRIKNNPYTS